MLNHEIHATHECYACGHGMGFTGDIFGEITISHGNEIDASITVVGERDDYIELGIQLQCPECGAINQFNALHPR